jgi:5'(3')-deoxyribonucleotidase
MKKEEGLRYNEGKTRFDLMEPYALEQLAKVFTIGAKKYADHNWLKGMAWSKVKASLDRHLNAFAQGVDYDPETGLHHMAHVAWNAMALVSYYKHYPQGDDRIHTIKRPLKIALDIDDVIADFLPEWCKLYNYPEPTCWRFDYDMYDKFKRMDENNTLNDFFLQLPVKIDPMDLKFEPVAYVTARSIPDSVTKEWLKLKGFPAAPVHSVGFGNSKLEVLKSLDVDIFVDDNIDHFYELNSNGVCCYLMDNPHNRKYNVGYKRIYSVNELLS